ncbi:MAG TPA: pirin family protein [Planctomycetota bacterium]|nr:pirin family protein [Planctomycetota bacterium]
MLTVRRAGERGHADHGWLRTWHSFSFADYFDPAHVHFRGLRVLNEDIVAPGQGFGMHPHRDMEILTWILAGSLRHEDSMGNGSVIRPGEVQVMSAGTGVLHSERNPSPAEPVHLLQIWIFPRSNNLAPRYEQRRVEDFVPGRLHRISGPPGSGAVTTIHADASVWAGRLDAGDGVAHAVEPGRGAWLQVARGKVTANGVELGAGDGASTEHPGELRIEALADGSEVLVFDLA